MLHLEVGRELFKFSFVHKKIEKLFFFWCQKTRKEKKNKKAFFLILFSSFSHLLTFFVHHYYYLLFHFVWENSGYGKEGVKALRREILLWFCWLSRYVSCLFFFLIPMRGPLLKLTCPHIHSETTVQLCSKSIHFWLET